MRDRPDRYGGAGRYTQWRKQPQSVLDVLPTLEPVDAENGAPSADGEGSTGR